MVIALTSLLLLSACNASEHQGSMDAADANASTAAAPIVVPSSLMQDAGTAPTILSTVGLYDLAPVAEVAAKQGRFAIVSDETSRHLAVNGIPWSYGAEAGVAPSPIEANNDIRLIGVLELPRESVAWVLITGGTACPGQHVLVSIKDGKAILGRAIPGCDDRGTIRRVDDHLVFEAGGSTGSYLDGTLAVASSADSGADG